MVTDRMIFAEALERSIPAEGIGVVDRAFLGARSDMAHERLGRDRFDNLGVDPAIALQQTENNTFAGGTATPLAFASTTEVGLV